eukprot:1251780-Pleurochrysis_carterae.AAC.1
MACAPGSPVRPVSGCLRAANKKNSRTRVAAQHLRWLANQSWPLPTSVLGAKHRVRRHGRER